MVVYNRNGTAITFVIGPIPLLLNDIVGYATDVFMLITIPLYILVLIAIIKNRNDQWLKHSFYSLMISTGIADICEIIFVLLLPKLAGYGWVPQLYVWMDSWASRLNMAVRFFAAASLAGVFFVAINRFTAFLLPLRHQKLWDGGKLLLYCIAIQWIFAIAIVLPILLSTGSFCNIFPLQPVNNNTITFNWSDAPQYNYVSMMIVEPLVLAIVILYLIIFIIVIKKTCFTSNFSANDRIAFRMTMIGFTHSFGLVISQHVPFTSNLAWNYFQINLYDPITLWFFINEGNEFYCSVNPYALLIFSKPVRKHFVRMFMPKCQWMVEPVNLIANPIASNPIAS